MEKCGREEQICDIARDLAGETAGMAAGGAKDRLIGDRNSMLKLA
jgi:hypothetical protein